MKNDFDFETLPEGLPSVYFIHFEFYFIHIYVFEALKCFDSGRWSEIGSETRVFYCNYYGINACLFIVKILHELGKFHSSFLKRLNVNKNETRS